MKRFLLIWPIIILTSQVFCQENAKVGTVAAQFLKIGLSARATGMAEAYTVVVDNSEAIFWNPGALARVENFDISASYVTWPAGIVYSGVALAKAFENIGIFGFHVAGLQLGDMRVRTIYNPQGDGQMFTASQFSTGLTFSRFLTEKFSTGLSIKYIQEDIWDYKASNWAIDIGTYYDTGYHSLVLGMSILNFGPDMQFNGDYIDYSDPDEESAADYTQKSFNSYPLPLSFRFGLAMHVLDDEKYKLLASLDAYKPNDNRQHVNAGAEFSFSNLLMLRAGYKFGYDEASYSFGMGIFVTTFDTFRLRLDYSYADLGILSIVHRGTVGFAF